MHKPIQDGSPWILTLTAASRPLTPMMLQKKHQPIRMNPDTACYMWPLQHFQKDKSPSLKKNLLYDDMKQQQLQVRKCSSSSSSSSRTSSPSVQSRRRLVCPCRPSPISVLCLSPSTSTCGLLLLPPPSPAMTSERRWAPRWRKYTATNLASPSANGLFAASPATPTNISPVCVCV